MSVTLTPPTAASSRNAVLFRADATALPLADASVDLIVTSPPYGAGIEYDAGGDVLADEWPAFMMAWLAEAIRVTKPSGRLALNVPLDMTTGGPTVGHARLSRPTYHQAIAAALSVGWLYKATITWDKHHHKKGNRGLGSLNSAARPHPIDPTETVILFSRGEWGPSSDRPDDIAPADWQEYCLGPWRFPGLPRRKGGHPAPFPAELPRRCIRLFSRVGDVVLDPFLGSGTTVVVALTEGRQGIGCDRSDAYLRAEAQLIGSTPLQLRAGTGCQMCHQQMTGRRRDAETCSARCRQQAYRQRLQVSSTRGSEIAA